MRVGELMWLALAVAVGVGMFLVKYKVQDLMDDLTSKQAEIAKDRSEMRVLEAEWTYLNDPERLRRLSAQHLGFGPPVPQNVIEVGGLPVRNGGANAPARVGTPPSSKPATTDPTINAEAELPLEPPALQRPAGLPVFLARLQRLLLPEAVGATTTRKRTP